MKKTTIISILLTAATALLCLCGVFFCSRENTGLTSSTEITSANPKAEFKSQKALEYLALCKSSYYPQSLEARFKEMGFGNFQYFVSEQATSADNGIAFGVATKENSIIAVFRGTEKEEWFSNFNIGGGEEHDGFSQAAGYAAEKLKEYAAGYNLPTKNTQMIITGHSRGAAVANIVASRFIDLENFKSVVGYTFATPCTTTKASAKDEKYQSIFNVLNPEDFICYIPLEEWGFTRYGTDFELPMKDSPDFSTYYKEMEECFYNKTGYKHIGFENHHEDVRSFLSAAYTIAPTVNDYYNKELAVYPYCVTLYEYMNKAAALLAGQDTLKSGMFLISGCNTPTLCTMTNFIMQGVDIEDVAKSNDLSTSAVASAHIWETYEAWLKVLPNDYFLVN